MTASTPPLVDVIAGAIAAHERLISQSLHQECGCGWVGKVLGFDHAAHQARAVLDALTKAGGVEWGMFRKSDNHTAEPIIRQFRSADEVRRHAEMAFLPDFAQSLEPRQRFIGAWTPAADG